MLNEMNVWTVQIVYMRSTTFIPENISDGVKFICIAHFKTIEIRICSVKKE